MSLDWADLYRAVYPDLVRYLYRKVWDEERAGELAQEVFVRALREEPDQPRAWLFTVAANLARDEIRTVIRRKKHLTLLKGEMQDQHAPDPSVEFEERSRRLGVKEALEQLSERDREVLLLWDAGCSYGDIAAQTGLSAGAIGTTLSRARKRLVEAHGRRKESDVAHP